MKDQEPKPETERRAASSSVAEVTLLLAGSVETSAPIFGADVLVRLEELKERVRVQDVLLDEARQRLADEAKQAAIAREQEEAARQRTAELARANRILRETTATLVDQPDLSSFLEQVLLAINRHLEAPGCTLWLRDEATQTENFFAFCHEDTIHRNPPPGGGFLPRLSFAVKNENQHANYNARQTAFLADAAYLPDIDETTRGWMLHYGSAGLLTVPLVIGQQVVGTIAVHKADNVPYPAEQVEIAVALAEQAGLAIHVSRLGEQAKQAAIAIEQEQAAKQRADELVRANAAVRETLVVMSEQPDLRLFLESVLKTVHEYLEAPGSTLWLYDEATGSMEFQAMYLGGDVLEDVPLEEGESWMRSYPWHPEFALALRGASAFFPDLPDIPTTNKGVAVWLRRNRIKAILNVPLAIGDRVLGLFILHKEDNIPFTSQQVELATVLAQQAALAIHVTRLSEEAKQAAIAIEREKAAQEQAAELVKTNAAIRETLNAMSAQSDIKPFLESVLRTAHHYLAAPASTLWLYDEADQTMHFEVMLLGEEVVRDLRQFGRACFKSCYPWTPKSERVVLGEAAFVIDSPDEPHLDEGTVTWLLNHRLRAYLNVPLVLGGRVLGDFGLHKRDNHPFSNAQIELATALGQQAALAIHMTRLAEETNAYAIARMQIEEQAKANQRLAADLREANRTMRSTMDIMSSIPDVDSFLGQIMITINQFMDASGSILWTVHPDIQRKRLRLACIDGQVGEAIPMAGGYSHETEFEITPSFEEQLARVQVERLTDVQNFAELGPGTAGWFRERGVRSLLSISMTVGGVILARLSIHLATNDAVPQHRQELAVALAQQGALALHMAQLAETAREAAISREQEAAAVLRAAEVERASLALQSTLDALASKPSLDTVVEQTLKTATIHLQAYSATVWLFDSKAQANDLLISYDGFGFHRATDGDTAPISLTVAEWEDWPRFLAERSPRILEYNESLTHADKIGGTSWMQGVRTIVLVPLCLGDEMLGLFSLNRADLKPWTASDLTLAHSFGHQLTLALRLMRLSEQAQFSAQIAATAQERGRIAAELHDGLQQLLLASQLWLRRVRDSKGEDKTQAIETLDELLQQLVLEARRAITTLRPMPSEGQSNPLTEQFKRLCRHVTSEHLKCAIESDLKTLLPPVVEDELYRIGQEAVTNVLKHAKASRIKMRVRETTDAVRLSIEDNGVGMAEPEGTGMGLQSMASRAKTIGAELSIDRAEEGGVSIEVTLPTANISRSLIGQ